MFVINIQVFTALVYISCASSLNKRFVASWDFSNSRNWEDGIEPCNGQSLSFGKKPEHSVFVDKSYSIKSLSWNHDVSIVLRDGVSLGFSDKKTEECKSKETEAVFRNEAPGYWWDPRSWDCTSSDHLQCNSAVPDLHRVPCQHDTVHLASTQNSMYRVTFTEPVPSVQHLFVDKKNMTTSEFTRLANSYMGKKAFHKKSTASSYVYIEAGPSCSDLTGCQCYLSSPQGEICRIVKKRCKKAACAQPIKMFGFCCDTCGADIFITINGTLSKKDVEDFVRSKLNEHAMKGLDAHVAWDTSAQTYHILLKVSTVGSSLSEAAEYISSQVSHHLNSAGRHRINVTVSGEEFLTLKMRRESSSSSGTVLVVIFILIVGIALVFFIYKKKGVNLKRIGDAISSSNYSFRRVSLMGRRESTLSTMTLATATPSHGVRFTNPMYNVTEASGDDEIAEVHIPEIPPPENPTQRSNPLFDIQTNTEESGISLSKLESSAEPEKPSEDVETHLDVLSEQETSQIIQADSSEDPQSPPEETEIDENPFAFMGDIL